MTNKLSVFLCVLFLSIFCFNGCTDFINVRTHTEIKINLDLNKIVKSRESRAMNKNQIANLPNDLFLKVSLYNAEKFQGQIENRNKLELITECKTEVINGTANIKLQNIPVGINAIIFADLYEKTNTENGSSEELIYAGNSSVFVVKQENNNVNVVLKKVKIDVVEEVPETPVIVRDPEIPTIINQPENIINVYASQDGAQNLSGTISCTASVSDGGTLSFEWYLIDSSNTYIVQNDNEQIGQNGTTSTISVDATIGQSKSYYCVVKNTLDEKTVSVQSNQVTIACVIGSFQSFSAKIDNNYQLIMGAAPDYNQITITEIYSSTLNGETSTTEISVNGSTVIGDNKKYSLTCNAGDSSRTVGYVPYKIELRDSNAQSSKFTIPTKYKLIADYLGLKAEYNNSQLSIDSNNQIEVPQYLSNIVYTYNDIYVRPTVVYDLSGEDIIDYDEIDFTVQYKNSSNTIIEQIPCESTGVYNVSLSTSNEWFVCDDTNKDFTINVKPWQINIATSDGTSVNASDLITGNSYKLSVSNDAWPSNVGLPEISFEGIDNSSGSFTIPTDFTSGTITAKYNNQAIASLNINATPSYVSGLTYQNVTGSDTLYISDEEGLITFRDIVNGSLKSNITVQGKITGSDKNFTANTSVSNVNAVLENDITISDEWTPIGVYSYPTTSANPYSGTFDGGGKTVTFDNITHNSIAMYSSGLFQMLAGTVKNLVIDGSISRTETGYIGGVVGYLDGGTIENCVNKATISNEAENGTGGIVGSVGNNNATITGCVNMGTVNSTQSGVGGIVGYSDEDSSNLTISKCINVGKVFGPNNVSGILGLSATTSITISNCMNLGKISATDSSLAYASGITTSFEDCTVSNSINVGEIAGVKKGGISSYTNYGYYVNNYYDNTVNTDVQDSNTSGITGKDTADLAGSNLILDGITSENWSFAESRYPLPNIESTLPVGTGEKSIWKQILDSAKVEISGGSGGSGSSGNGMVYVAGTTITGTESWTPSSTVFFTNRDQLTIKNLYVCDHEVTRGEYKTVMGTDPSTAKAHDQAGNELSEDAFLNNPVNYVTWYDAIAYCNELTKIELNEPDCVYYTDSSFSTVYTSSDASSQRTPYFNKDKNGYRLPTEAEWEWLARGNQNYTYAGSDTVKDVAWYGVTTGDTGTRDVKTKTPNGYNLYDMSGNVSEWCWDWKADNLANYTIGEDGPVTGTDRVVRGGGYDDDSTCCAVNYRSGSAPTNKQPYRGFRVVRTAESTSGSGGVISYQVGDVLNSVSFDNNEYQFTNMIIVANEEITITGTNSPSWNGFTAGNIAFGVFIEGRNIKLSPFAMGQYEVTQELYQAVMNENPSNFKTDNNLPVEKVSWYKIIAFCNSLSEKMNYEKVYFSDEDKTTPYTLEDANSNRTVYMDISKNGYRLPTEAEWEYAARFDQNNTNWNYSYSGIDTTLATIDASTNIDTSINYVGWYTGNASSTTHIVGQQDPNGLGLFDMTGNVWELCWDPVSSNMPVTENDNLYSKDGYIYNPQGGNQSNCTYRVKRGGSFYDSAYMQTVLYRNKTDNASSTSYSTGFRLCRSL